MFISFATRSLYILLISSHYQILIFNFPNLTCKEESYWDRKSFWGDFSTYIPDLRDPRHHGDPRANAHTRRHIHTQTSFKNFFVFCSPVKLRTPFSRMSVCVSVCACVCLKIVNNLRTTASNQFKFRTKLAFLSRSRFRNFWVHRTRGGATVVQSVKTFRLK